MNICSGGEVYDFIKWGGKLPEKISRSLFRQLLQALQLCHTQGFAHRDIKLENVLFDDRFNLILSDFGFAVKCVEEGKSIFLDTLLGTPGYMAPELHAKVLYDGFQVDIFAAGILLFILHAGHPPFASGNLLADSRFKNFVHDKEQFWKNHAHSKPGKMAFFSPAFVDLITKMLAFKPTDRPTVQQVLEHPWFSDGPIASPEEIIQYFGDLQESVEQKLIAHKLELEQQLEDKKRKQAVPATTTNVAFTGIGKAFRDLIIKQEGLDELCIQGSLDSIQQLESLKLERVVPVYRNFGSKKMTNFYSTLPAKDVLKMLAISCHAQSKRVELFPESYKLESRIPGKLDYVTVQVGVFQDGAFTVAEFIKLEGDFIEYCDIVHKLRENLKQLQDQIFHDTPESGPQDV